MLTPEERWRIEEEERRKLAEEQYRAEVRAKLQQQNVPPQNTAEGSRPARVLWIVGIAAALVIGAVILANNSSTRATGDGLPSVQAAPDPVPVPKTRYVPVTQKIATGQITVQANGYVQYRIIIAPEMVEPRITGNFNASGGAGNDIQAVIADEENYTNWINGHEAQVFWGTPGKQVFLDLDLNYKKAETYY